MQLLAFVHMCDHEGASLTLGLRPGRCRSSRPGIVRGSHKLCKLANLPKVKCVDGGVRCYVVAASLRHIWSHTRHGCCSNTCNLVWHLAMKHCIDKALQCTAAVHSCRRAAFQLCVNAAVLQCPRLTSWLCVCVYAVELFLSC